MGSFTAEIQPETDGIQPETAPTLPDPGAGEVESYRSPGPDPQDILSHQLQEARLVARLETLYNEIDIVKMGSLRRFAEELNRNDGEPGKDLQKESQTVMKAVEIQARLLAERRRNDDEAGFEPALNDIWQALVNLPEAGAILRRESVRARLLQTLRQMLG